MVSKNAPPLITEDAPTLNLVGGDVLNEQPIQAPSIQTDLHNKHRELLIERASEALKALHNRQASWSRYSKIGGAAFTLSALTAVIAWQNGLPPTLNETLLPEIVNALTALAQAVADPSTMPVDPFAQVFDKVFAIVDGTAVKILGMMCLVIGVISGIARNSPIQAMTGVAAGLMVTQGPMVMKTIVGSADKGAHAAQIRPDTQMLAATINDSDSPLAAWGSAVPQAVARVAIADLLQKKEWAALAKLIISLEPSSARTYTQLQLNALSAPEAGIDPALHDAAIKSEFTVPASVSSDQVEYMETYLHGKPLSDRGKQAYAERLEWQDLASDARWLARLAGSLMLICAGVAYSFRRRVASISDWITEQDKQASNSDEPAHPKKPVNTEPQKAAQNA